MPEEPGRRVALVEERTQAGHDVSRGPSRTVEQEKVPQCQSSQVGALRLWKKGIKQAMMSAELEAGTFEHAGCVLLVEI